MGRICTTACPGRVPCPQVATAGLQALNLTLDFDEQEVLQANQDYLVSTLEVRTRREDYLASSRLELSFSNGG